MRAAFSDVRTHRKAKVATKKSTASESLPAQNGKGSSVTKYLKNQVVFSQGDPADAVFHIQKGKLKVTAVSDRGKEAVAAILGPDEFFGEACMAGQLQRLVTVSAMTEAIVERIEKNRNDPDGPGTTDLLADVHDPHSEPHHPS